ncbi:hypothetical protein HDF26_002485 [Pedobacter cryoconitis]|uniref:Uncharacterized protein n=1 Tax=Pedobacter cryoconitis TaxID=188932 RepID=A0A7W9DY40_9SPHI|nr:hypothetical protein [Pedobacter cryoconitis]MBB5634839.1 hypothetical protein [Pedobacter cryoconitis]MBB6272028.1 hypothetical protein [Pedobacter cryoconitis]
MSYNVTKFEVIFEGKPIAVAVHSVTDGEETNHIVSIDDHENFEIRLTKENKWKADNGTGINEELLALITAHYQAP